MLTHRFQNLIQFLKGEIIKKKKSGLFWMAIIFGAIVPVVAFVATMINPTVHKPGVEFNSFIMSFEDLTSSITSFFLVILIILNASKIAQLDHKNGGWQLMDLLPLRKSSVYFGKFILLTISNVIHVLSFMLFMILAIALKHLIFDVPEEALTNIPWTYLFFLFLKINAAAFLLTSFQYVLSVIIPSYVWSLSIGLLLFISSSILAGFSIFYPFNPVQIVAHTGNHTLGGEVNNYFLYTEKFSFFAGLILLCLGYWMFRNKGFYRAFLKSNLQKFVSPLVFIGLLIAAYSYLTPSVQSSHHRTVISGTLKSDYDIQYAVLMRPTLNDTLAIIPIENEKFHLVIDSELPLARYWLIFQNYFTEEFFIGKNDSIHLNTKFQNGSKKTILRGTRLAENSVKETNFQWDYNKYLIENGYNIDEFQNQQRELLSTTQTELSRIRSFRSVDNLTYRDDFRKIIEKEVIVEHLLLKETLEKNVKAKFPEKEIKWAKGWEELESRISRNDIELLDNRKYIDYLTMLILKEDDSDIAENIKVLKGLKALPKGEFRDKILFANLIKGLENSNTKDERDELAEFISYVDSPRLRNNLRFTHQNQMKLSKTKPAEDIIASTLDNKTVKLSDLKGKWVLIDFWATWCGPCLYESPYFEKMAIKYKKENVAFVAISLDQRKDKWETDAKSKSKSVLQWHADDLQKTNFDFSIQGIPRFVMIDPEGNFYQSKMARPSEAAFEMILRKALGLPDLE